MNYLEKKYDVAIWRDVGYAQKPGYYCSYALPKPKVKAVADKRPRRLKVSRLNLRLDLYAPRDAQDDCRPTILFFHGGGFFFDDKESHSIVRLCRAFAARGYNAVSVDYRLGFQYNKKSMRRAEERAIADGLSALRFLCDHRDEYGIDPRRIILAGSSAGAMVALQMPYRPLPAGVEVCAVVNLWGAIPDLTLLRQRPDLAIISFHGGKDYVVPPGYGSNYHRYFGPLSLLLCRKKYGSVRIHQEAKRLKMRERLFFFPKLGHKLYWDRKRQAENAYFDLIDARMTEFLADVVRR